MNAKRFFSYFVLMALIPLMLAYLVLTFGWFTPGATAKGTFVETEIQLPFKSAQESRPTWTIIAQPAADCQSLCEEALYGLNQTYGALGKLQKRVTAKVLNSKLDLSTYPHLNKINLSHGALKPDQFYLVDPFGKVILRYPVGPNREQTIKSSKAILADIKKLLNYSRVG
jgi:cytochrome oxidase Cu insertion factor (SCO1/SenC/PrrC family)